MACFHGERIVGTVGRVTRTDRLCAVPETRVTASNHRPAGSGDSRPASAASTGSAPALEGEAQPTPRARTDPRPFPAEALALVVMYSPHLTHSVSGISRLQPSILARAWPAHGGSRRRAPLKSSPGLIFGRWSSLAQRAHSYGGATSAEHGTRPPLRRACPASTSTIFAIPATR
jgi:hypothetical protein